MGLSIQVDPYSGVPIYEQLILSVSALVATGEAQSDEKLPSVRQLARELGVNPNTVQRAYTELERQGVVKSAAGRGSFIGDANEAINAALTLQLSGVKEVLARARKNGLPKQAVLTLVESVYRQEEGSSC